jgi:histidinol dehydrogenase
MKIVKGYSLAKPLLDRTLPFARSTASPAKTRQAEDAVEQTVREIIADVQKNGDKALYRYAKKFDKANLASLKVSDKEVTAAYKLVDKQLVSALKLAAKRIQEFHSICKHKIDSSFFEDGLGRQVRPLEKIGLYVPGGTAAYPSTVLMTAIPAKVAGVKDISIVTPPKKDGAIPPSTLVAADLAGVNNVYKTGGAQAIAALAYGTETVPKVDKICGPGNIYVANAKKMVFGIVDIDGLQGPSEIVLIADESADPSFCAADLIAQTEHDPMASALFIATSSGLVDSVNKEIVKQLKTLERREIVEAAFDSRGMFIQVETVDEAIDLANLYAPEHLLLMIKNARNYVKKIKNAGCVFLGKSSPVAIGDYIAGPSHVLPTGGTARFSSPLGVEDFLKATNIVSLAEDEFNSLAKQAIIIAESEGLQAHARAMKIRMKSKTALQK